MKTASLLFLLCASSFVLAQAPREDSSASSIRALEHQWVEGNAEKDTGILELIFDDALVYVEYGRLVTKHEYLSRIKSPQPNPSQVALESMTVQIFGSTAIVIGTYQEKFVKGTTSHLRRWRFLDTWAYKKNCWVLVAAGSSPLPR